MNSHKGFTLIELMIVVAIIGILAAIAIPNFLAMQLRAKRSELPTNIDAIRTVEKAYHAEWSAFTACLVQVPATNPGRTKTAFTGSGYNAFELLGWVADGKVYGQYSVVATQGASVQTDDFTATGYTDVDGDVTAAQYNGTRALKAYMVSANNVY